MRITKQTVERWTIRAENDDELVQARKFAIDHDAIVMMVKPARLEMAGWRGHIVNIERVMIEEPTSLGG